MHLVAVFVFGIGIVIVVLEVILIKRAVVVAVGIAKLAATDKKTVVVRGSLISKLGLIPKLRAVECGWRLAFKRTVNY
ncbi:hypothetical protein BDW68DRAFT_160466 [Aspergillus falconensis]